HSSRLAPIVRKYSEVANDVQIDVLDAQLVLFDLAEQREIKPAHAMYLLQVPPTDLVEMIGGDRELMLRDGLGRAVSATELRLPTLRTDGHKAVVLAFGIVDDLPRLLQW